MRPKVFLLTFFLISILLSFVAYFSSKYKAEKAVNSDLSDKLNQSQFELQRALERERRKGLK